MANTLNDPKTNRDSGDFSKQSLTERERLAAINRMDQGAPVAQSRISQSQIDPRRISQPLLDQSRTSQPFLDQSRTSQPLIDESRISSTSLLDQGLGATKSFPLNGPLNPPRPGQHLQDHQTPALPTEPQRIAAFSPQEQRLDVVQESIKVGKREVDRGGVRVESKLVETPFDEEITLRAEHVQVDRHAVNRPVTPGDTTAFREGQIELHERAEEAVVAKEARVVEEVVIGKTVDQKVEKIHETLRHTEVAVNRVGGTEKISAFRAFETYDPDFRKDYEVNYAIVGAPYERYAPLYRYGYNLATAQQFSNKDWLTVEPEAKSAWEEHNPGTWDQVKNAVRHAWDRVTGKL